MTGNFVILMLILLGILILLLFIVSVLGYYLTPFYLERLAEKDDATYQYRKKTYMEEPFYQLTQQDPFPQLNVDKESGLYSVMFGDKRTLQDGLVKIHFSGKWYSSQPEKTEQSLILIEYEVSTEEDHLGMHTVRRLYWQCENNTIQTVFKEYQKSPILIFGCHFPEGLDNVSTKDFYEPIIVFPSFKNLSFNKKIFTFRNNLFAPPTAKITKPTSSPILFYDNDLNTFIISSMNNFMLGLIRLNNGSIECGIEGEITAIPKDFIMNFIVYFGKGINQSFKEWGDILLKIYQTERKSSYADPILSYLGYWTDNGAYYYYRTEKGLNYEQTLEKLDNYVEHIKLPIKYYQLDSWWYKKAYRWMPFRIIKLFIGGNLEWAPLEKNFPNGLSKLSKKMKKPFIAHNRWFDKRNLHFRKYPHIIENFWGHPISYDFWHMVMKRCQDYNIVVYEQDWLKNQFEHFKYLRENVLTSRQWLQDMATAAERHNITIQYCMPTPAFFLQSIEFKSVTQIRCAQDYNARFPKSFYIPNFTQTSLLAYAVGLWPFLDCFLSSSRQTYKTRYKEKFPELVTLMSILSGGLVGPADQIGYLNKNLLMKTCRSDGLLLKPDRPATPIDLMFQRHGKYYITSTESKKGDLTWYYIVMTNFFPNRIKDNTISLKELGISQECIMYDFNKEKTKELKNKTPISIDLRKNQFYYFILAPLVEGKFAFIGNPLKFVVCSSKQFPSVKYTLDSLTIDIHGVKGEALEILVYSTVIPKKVILNANQIPQKLGEKSNYPDFWLYEIESKNVKIKFTLPKINSILLIQF